MKCRHCGEELRVVATREIGEGYVPKRTRECANGHRYNTYEIDDSLYSSSIRTALAPTRIGAFVAASLRWKRDAEIVARARAGEKYELISMDTGLSRNRVSEIVSGVGLVSKRIAPARRARFLDRSARRSS